MFDHLRIVRCGAIGKRVLRPETTGSVAAVFAGSFYLEANGSFVCIGAGRLGPGPLNAIADAPAATDWPASGMRCGMPFTAAADRLYIPGAFTFATDGMATWRPPPYPDPPEAARLAHHLDALRRAYRGRLPDQGLARPLLGPRDWRDASPLARVARSAAAALGDWLIAALSGGSGDPPPRALTAVAGLGPGLTPSGDDFLGGLLLALDAVGARAVRDRLAPAALRAVRQESHPISAAHLQAAAEGYGGGAIHDLLADVLAGRVSAFAARLDAIDRIGHCSGWDTLAGVVTALDAVVTATAGRDRGALHAATA